MAMTTSSSIRVNPRATTARDALLIRFLIIKRTFLDD
jgi:hypothetical protein